MKLGKLLYAIAGGVDAIIKPLTWVACGVLGAMTLVVVINVVGRFLLNQPLSGTIELVELMIVIVTFIAIPYTAVKRGHVRVGVVISRLSRRAQAILGSIGFFLSAGIFAVITYQGGVVAMSYAQNLSRTTDILFIPFAPFKFVMVLGCLLLCLKLLEHVFHPIPPEEGRKGGLSR